jgi:hypothetical protein
MHTHQVSKFWKTGIDNITMGLKKIQQVKEPIKWEFFAVLFMKIDGSMNFLE